MRKIPREWWVSSRKRRSIFCIEIVSHELIENMRSNIKSMGIFKLLEKVDKSKFHHYFLLSHSLLDLSNK